MKKAILICFIVLLCLSITSCGVDFTEGKKPINYYSTTWISTDPDIWFAVQETRDWSCLGEVNLDGVKTEIKVRFNPGTSVYFRPIDAEIGDDYLFLGTCKFGKEKLVVKITNNSKGFLDDSVKTITFERIDDPEPLEEEPPLS